MKENENKDSEQKKVIDEEDHYYRYFVAVIIVFLVYLALILVKTWPISEYSIGKAGVFGDSFGIITSLFTGLAFAGILITLKYQRKDLLIARDEFKLTRDEMKQARLDAESQAIERTFFNMVKMYNDLVENLEFTRDSSIKGVRCFNTYVGELTGIIFSNYDEEIVKNINGDQNELLKNYDLAYEEFYETHHTLLGHYFRYLYRIFKFINENTGDKAELYSKILRSQLTNTEMLLLFYNGLSRYGYKNFKPLLEKYKIFDNLPVKMLVVQKHALLYEKKVWGENFDYKILTLK